MAKKHVLDIYECSGDAYCIGCVDAEEEPSPEESASDPTPAARPEELPPAAAEAEEGEWVEVELVDDDDEPVAEVLFEVTLPDGSVVQGTTSADGVARIPSPSGGDCQIKFPELPQGSWEKL